MSTELGLLFPQSGISPFLSHPFTMIPPQYHQLSFLSIFLGLQKFALGSYTGQDLTQYVKPFIGTEGQGTPGTAIGAGNVFPGVALPFGVVKFGIDTTAFDWTNVDANAGYTPDGYGMVFLLELC